MPAAGTYALDASHCHVGFSVRHLMVSKTKGRFADFTGTVNIAEDPLESSVEVEIQVASIDTRDEARDGHLRSADFFDAENHPTHHLPLHQGHAGRASGRWTVEGELTVRGVTRAVPLEVTFEGGAKDPWGSQPHRLHRPRRAGPRGLRPHLEPGPRDRRRAGRQAGAGSTSRPRPSSSRPRPSSPDLWIGGGEIHLQFTGCSPSGPQARFPRLRNRARGRGVIGPDWWQSIHVCGGLDDSCGGPWPLPWEARRGLAPGPAEKDRGSVDTPVVTVL